MIITKKIYQYFKTHNLSLQSIKRISHLNSIIQKNWKLSTKI